MRGTKQQGVVMFELNEEQRAIQKKRSRLRQKGINPKASIGIPESFHGGLSRKWQKWVLRIRLPTGYGGWELT